ncbi:MAG: hypothetical protein IJV41_11515 [Oscillospiraceae bacterium]|nr:hypothetical protein [Oscillospiraceae bacterium]
MLDQTAEGLSVRQKYTYTWRDVILYNLSVGAGFDQQQFVYEKGLKAIPTFGVMPCTATFGTEPYTELPLMPTALIPDLKTAGTLHMEHELRIERPIALNAALDVEKRIAKVYDRGEGKGVKLVVEIIARDEDGQVCFTNTMSYLNRWYGGFGGERAPKAVNPVPEREPDLVVPGRFAENAPLLYRLAGDTYPIHADVAAATAVGFRMPIVHGLCSLGYACRMIVESCFDGDPDRLRTIRTQFRSIAYPGDEFDLQLWRLDGGICAFRMVNREGASILDAGCVNG